MNILIACDKFKGSLNALKVCESIKKGILKNDPNACCKIQPLADGGDGTLQVLQNCHEFNRNTIDTIDPLHRKIKADYLSDGNSAYIELAQASGITRLKKSELNILKTTTIGTGILIKHALENNHQNIILSVGGSCTNDLGFGIAYALGFSFLDYKNEIIIPSGSNLNQIIKINSPLNPITTQFTILCDVENPLYGKDGAAQIYGPQKGATQDDIVFLDKSMLYISELIEKEFGRSISYKSGGGAAGGIPAGLFGLLKNVTIKNGFDYMSQLTHLEEKVRDADLVISGEGQLDNQSLQGKVVGRLALICKKNHTPLIAVTGSSTISNKVIENLNLKTVIEVIKFSEGLEDSMKNCGKYLEEIGSQIKLQ